MNKGAQPTDTVKNLFSKDGIMKNLLKLKQQNNLRGRDLHEGIGRSYGQVSCK